MGGMVGWGERTLGFSLLTGFVLLFDETYDHDKQRDLLTKWVMGGDYRSLAFLRVTRVVISNVNLSMVLMVGWESSLFWWL